MAGIVRSHPQPIAQHVHSDLRRRNELVAINSELRANMRGISGRGLFAIESQPETWYRGMSAAGPVYDAQSRNTASQAPAPTASAQPASAQVFKAAMDIDSTETLTSANAAANASANTITNERADEEMADAAAEVKPGEGTSIAKAEDEMQI